jgi:hypothetical protein
MWRRMLCATTLSFDLPFTSEHPSPNRDPCFSTHSLLDHTPVLPS